jgi:hypothetical protein
MPRTIQVYDADCRVMVNHMVLEGGQVTSIQACQNQGCVTLIVGASAVTVATVMHCGIGTDQFSGIQLGIFDLPPTDDAANDSSGAMSTSAMATTGTRAAPERTWEAVGPTIADGADRRRH